MEEISEIYEDVDIRAWAQDIRLFKVRELKEMIENYKGFIKNADDYFQPERYINIARNEIDKLQNKIDILNGNKS